MVLGILAIHAQKFEPRSMSFTMYYIIIKEPIVKKEMHNLLEGKVDKIIEGIGILRDVLSGTSVAQKIAQRITKCDLIKLKHSAQQNKQPSR